MTLRKFIIERDIPKVGTFERDQLRGAAAKSNEVLAELFHSAKSLPVLAGKAPDISFTQIVNKATEAALSTVEQHYLPPDLAVRNYSGKEFKRFSIGNN